MPEQFTFFWSGPFSQWHGCRFTIDGVVYNCTEQYMMAGKARLFGDAATEKLILAAKKPGEQKSLGRKVRPFDNEIWLAAARTIVYRGSEAKFTQNEGLFGRLMATKGTTLVEASPLDPLWGIGIAEDDPRARDRAQWQGQNWLGEILTQLRNDLEQKTQGGSS
jgi:ribA/ribD-fused uncharacterized protein